jgi:ankyrin repeat protein
MVAVVETGDAHIVSRLVEMGANVDAVVGAGRTALDMAKERHLARIVEILRKVVVEK